MLGFLFLPLIRKLARQRLEKETYYDELDPCGPEFLDIDRRNFRIKVDVIRKVVVSKGRSLMWAPHSVGTLDFHVEDRHRWRFILVGEQDIEGIRLLFDVLAVEIEIK
jgi:hypothetical protein